MSPPSIIAAGQALQKQDVATPFDRLPGPGAGNAPPSPPRSEPDMRARIADYLADYGARIRARRRMTHGKSIAAHFAAEKARQASRRPPTPPAEPIQSDAKPEELDMGTKIQNYMAAHHVKWVARTSPRRVLRELRLARLIRELDGMEQEIGSASPAPAKSAFGSVKSKELDSGIVSLETPSCLHAVKPPSPSPTLSTASSPATFSFGRLRPLSPVPPPRSPFTVAHDAVALARTKLNFDEAQKVYPADAAVFVGNLPAGLTDLQLCYELMSTFTKFGHLYVQVSRQYTADAVKPTAILQFTHPYAATKAVKSSREPRIGGRKLRVDRSQANRSLLLLRDGALRRPYHMPKFQWSSIMINEVAVAMQQFCHYGPFDEAFPARIPFEPPGYDGVRLTFTNYGQFLAAKKALQAGALPYKEMSCHVPSRGDPWYL